MGNHDFMLAWFGVYSFSSFRLLLVTVIGHNTSECSALWVSGTNPPSSKINEPALYLHVVQGNSQVS